MIAAHLRKERALTRCRYSVENCPPPPARERPVACYNFEKPRVRRVNRDACRRGAGAQLLKGLLEDKLRRTWAALAPAGPPPRLAQAAPAAVARCRRGARSTPPPRDGSGAPGPRCADRTSGRSRCCWGRVRRAGAEILSTARGVRSDAASRLGAARSRGGGRGSTPSRAPSTALPVFGAGDCSSARSGGS